MAFLRSRRLHGGLFVEVGAEGVTLEAQRFAFETEDLLADGCFGVSSEEVACLLGACACAGGGYAPHPPDPPTYVRCRADLGATYYACRLNARLQAPAELNCTRRWLTSAAFDEHQHAVRVDLDELYYVLRGLSFAHGALSRSERLSVFRFLLACQVADGGFAVTPGGTPDIERTYCGVHLARQLGLKLDDRLHRRWVASCIDVAGAIHWDPTRRHSTAPTLYWGVRAAELVGSKLDRVRLARALLVHMNDDGGFGEPGRSTIWDTYCAMHALAHVKRTA